MIADKEIARIAKSCRKHGVKRLKQGEFEIELTDRKPGARKKTVAEVDLTAAGTLPPMPNDREMLLAASPFEMADEPQSTEAQE